MTTVTTRSPWPVVVGGAGGAGSPGTGRVPDGGGTGGTSPGGAGTGGAATGGAATGGVWPGAGGAIGGASTGGGSLGGDLSGTGGGGGTSTGASPGCGRSWLWAAVKPASASGIANRILVIPDSLAGGGTNLQAFGPVPLCHRNPGHAAAVQRQTASGSLRADDSRSGLSCTFRASRGPAMSLLYAEILSGRQQP